MSRVVQEKKPLTGLELVVTGVESQSLLTFTIAGPGFLFETV